MAGTNSRGGRLTIVTDYLDARLSISHLCHTRLPSIHSGLNLPCAQFVAGTLLCVHTKTKLPFGALSPLNICLKSNLKTDLKSNDSADLKAELKAGGSIDACEFVLADGSGVLLPPDGWANFLGVWEPYKSPEMWFEDAGPSFAGDVYAFGCLLFFLMTHRPPWSGLERVQIIRRMRAGLGPHHSRDLCADSYRDHPQLFDIMVRCLAIDPLQRPSLPQIIAALQPTAPHRKFDDLFAEQLHIKNIWFDSIR
jgi:hypothetical protein